MRRNLYILLGVLVVFVLINVLFVFNFNKESQIDDKLINISADYSQAFLFPISEPSYVPILNTTIEKPQISAQSAVVYDLKSSKYLYSKNINLRLPIASLTKLMTAVVVMELLNLDDIVTVPKEAIKIDGEKQTLYLGEKIKVRDLLKMMLIESSNDAAYALKFYAASLGIDLIQKMNAKAVELGMINSIFHDPAGLNDEASSTAEDLIKLVKFSMRFNDIWIILAEKISTIYSVDGKIEHRVKNTNQLLDIIPGVLGGKTGYTEKALGCMILLVEVSDKNDKLISVVIGSKERFTDTQKIINWARNAYIWY